jgi:hypothetical protein
LTCGAVQVDFFFDFLCPDSKAAFPVLATAVSQLSKMPQRMNVELRLHMFPLVRTNLAPPESVCPLLFPDCMIDAAPGLLTRWLACTAAVPPQRDAGGSGGRRGREQQWHPRLPQLPEGPLCEP